MFLWLDLEHLHPDWTGFISRGTRQRGKQEKCAGGKGSEREGEEREDVCVRVCKETGPLRRASEEQ